MFVQDNLRLFVVSIATSQTMDRSELKGVEFLVIDTAFSTLHSQCKVKRIANKEQLAANH